MLRNLQQPLLALALLCTSLSVLPEPIESVPELKYLMIIGQSRPLQMLDTQGKPSGLISDLVHELTKEHYPLEVIRLPYKRLIHEVRANRHPNWIGYGAKTWNSPMAKNTVDCVIHQAKHSLITLADAAKIRQLSDLNQRRIIMMHGFSFKELEPSLNSGKISQLRVNNYQAAFKSIKMGRGLGFLEMDIRIRYNLMANKFNAKDFHIQDVSNIILPYPIYLALDPTMPEAHRKSLTEQCQKLQTNGVIEEIHRKYADY